MNTTRRSVAKTWSALGKAVHSKAYLRPSTVSLIGLHKGSLPYRIDKSGFKVPRYQNTYRLAPYKPFKCEVVDKILINVMQNYLFNLKYQPQVVCESVRKCRKKYKVVVIMSIIQKLGQNVQTDFGKLWDIQRDTYSTYVIETPEFAAMGLVVGTYYE